MPCPCCKRAMTAMPAPPATTVYVCDNTACGGMNDVINPTVDPRS